VQNNFSVKFEVLMALTHHIIIFWEVTSLIAVIGDERFGEACYVHLQVREVFPPKKHYSELLTVSFRRTPLISITVLISLPVSLFISV
jgi:hypothetical protein